MYNKNLKRYFSVNIIFKSLVKLTLIYLGSYENILLIQFFLTSKRGTYQARSKLLTSTVFSKMFRSDSKGKDNQAKRQQISDLMVAISNTDPFSTSLSSAGSYL